ncbi:MAG: AI-2E family transporter [Oscillospiraceae bacterium]|nr:AI-2E family transporter [Oscillospiraceae bacterium]
MKLDWKTCFKAVVSVAILFLFIHFVDSIFAALGIAMNALVPLIAGLVIAYVVNIPMSFYERNYFPNSAKSAVAKSRRPVCMLLGYLTIILVIFLVLLLVIPQFVSCIKTFINQLPSLVLQILENKTIVGLLPESVINWLEGIDWNEIASNVSSIIGIISLLSTSITDVISDIRGTVDTVTSVAPTVISVFSTVIVGVVFSVYFLSAKDKILGQIRKLSTTYLKPKWHEKIYYVLGTFNESYHGYIVVQCTEAVLLGTLCTIGMSILQLPYSTMIGALIGLTALIPIVGAWIGTIIGAFMILTVSPIQALIFVLFILVLQFVDNYFIYPKIVGRSIGLPSVWVLMAVSVGGGVFGIPGMLICVPLFSAIYKLIKTDVAKRNSESSREEENDPAPTETIDTLPEASET